VVCRERGKGREEGGRKERKEGEQREVKGRNRRGGRHRRGLGDIPVFTPRWPKILDLHLDSVRCYMTLFAPSLCVIITVAFFMLT